MALSSWFCPKNTRNMFVKIVHPGGHVELHDRPILAAEIMLRNPRYCVAHPHVFRQPWAIITPGTMLMPGQKFYVVPISTIRRLQRHSSRCSPRSPLPQQNLCDNHNRDEEEAEMVSDSWLFVNKSTPNRLKQSDDEGYKMDTYQRTEKGTGKDGSDDNCFMCLLTGIYLKGKREEDSSDDTTNTVGSSESRELNRKRTKNFERKVNKDSPKRHTSFNNWQPNLEKINEE